MVDQILYSMIVIQYIQGVLLILNFISSANAQNPCHSDCVPFQCNGPLESHCHVCTGNREVVQSQCSCKLGYFDFNNQKCSVYSQDCIVGIVGGDGSIFCTKCRHGINGPINGACVYKDFKYYESSSTMSNIMRTNSKSIYFYNFCSSLFGIDQTQIACTSCKLNYYQQVAMSTQCSPCPLAGCRECEAITGTCISGCADGLYLNNGICKFCFFSCNQCSGSEFDQCSTCKSGFYWTQNAENLLGTCVSCHSNCLTCYGPGPTHCGKLNPGFFWTDFGLLTNSTSACDPSCSECSGNPTFCSQCSLLSITPDPAIRSLNDGTCDFFTPTPISNCFETVQNPDNSYSCQFCEASNFFDQGSGYCTNSADLVNNCFAVFPTSDSRGVYCTICNPGAALNHDNQNCLDASGLGAACSYSESYGLKNYCMKCDSPQMVDVDTGICISTCTSSIPNKHRNALTFGNTQICMWMPYGCLNGHFINGMLFCDACDTANNFLKMAPTDFTCMNLICNNEFPGSNKECNPIVNTGVCDPILCFRSDSVGECTSGNCQRKIFEVTVKNLDLGIQISQKYKNWLSFDIEDYIVYETVSNTEKKVFCRLISDDLNDDLSLCTFKDGVLLLKVIPSIHSKIMNQGLTLKPSIFKVYRKMLSLDGININSATYPSFSISPQASFVSSSGTFGNNWNIDYQSSMTFTKGIKADVFAITNKFSFVSYSWSCSSIKPTSASPSNSALVTELNGLLGAFNNKPLSLVLSNTQFVNQIISMTLTIVGNYQDSHSIPLIFTLVNQAQVIEQAIPGPVKFIEADGGVYIPLLTTVTNINTNDLLVVADGLTGSFSYNFEKRSTHLILNAKVTFGNDFTMNITYQANPVTQIRMLKITPNFPSTIIFEKTADNLTPFEFQLLNRISTFKVYCIDESTKTLCLPNPISQTYNTGDSIVLQDLFSFTTEGPKLVFFRLALMQDETICSIVIDGKTNAQPKIPKVTTREIITFPESVFFEDSSMVYFDFKYSTITSLNGALSEIVDPGFSTNTFTPSFSIDTSMVQASITTTPVGFRENLVAQCVLNATETREIVLSRFISQSSLNVATQNFIMSSVGGMMQIESKTLFLSSELCNSPAGQFMYSTIIDNSFYVHDYTSYFKRKVMPMISTSSPFLIKTKVHSYCGIFSSSEASIFDTTGISFSSNISVYTSTIIGSTTTEQKEQMNTWVLLLSQLRRAYKQCVATPNQCVATKNDIIYEAGKVFAKLTDTYLDNKFYMTSRYSLYNGFVLDYGFINDPTLENLMTSLENMNNYISDQLNTILTSNGRLTRRLHQDLSLLNLIQSDMVDYPLLLNSNIFSSILFAYSNDTYRNAFVNRSISNIVRNQELKMIRVSSHKRTETYEDDNFLIQAKTVLSPLDSNYQFQLDDKTKLVFKDLSFSNLASYYEIIVINWKQSLLDKMKTIYNETTSDFVKRQFYVDFMSIFKVNIPVSGEAQIYKTPGNCPSPQPASCTPITVPGYSLCTCYNASDVANKSPTTEKSIPPVVPTAPTNPPQEPSPPTNPISNFGKDFGTVVNNGNSDSLDVTKVKNFKTWSFLTLAMQGIFMLSYIIALYFRKLLDSNSDDFAEKISTQVLIHKILLEINQKKQIPGSGEVEVSLEKNKEESYSTSASTKNQLALKKLEGILSKTEIEKNNIQTQDMKPLQFWRFYLNYLKMNQMVSSIAFLKSDQYYKFTILTLTYLRIVTHLAISMYFTIGVQPDDYSKSQQWILRNLVIPVPNLIISLALRKLMTGEITPTLSIVKPKCKVGSVENLSPDYFDDPSSKASSPKNSEGAPKNRDVSSDKERDNGERVSSFRKKPVRAQTRQSIKHHSRTISFDELLRNSVPSTPLTPQTSTSTHKVYNFEDKDQSESNGVSKKGASWRRSLGRILMVCIAAGSLYAIISLSISGNKTAKEAQQNIDEKGKKPTTSNGWPWGYWYLLSFFYDQLVFQPLMTLVQYLLVFKTLCMKDTSQGFKKFTHFIIGVDLMNILTSKLKSLN